MASSTALENLPVEFRGIASGVIQQGYAVGYLIAAVINLYLVPKTSLGWRSLFYAASAISFFAAILRALLPESEVFSRAKAAEKANGTTTKGKTKIFLKETKNMIMTHWLLFIYAVLLMTGKVPLLSNLLSLPFVHSNCLPSISNDVTHSNRLQLPLSRISGKSTPRFLTKGLPLTSITGSLPHIPSGVQRLYPSQRHCRDHHW